MATIFERLAALEAAQAGLARMVHALRAQAGLTLGEMEAAYLKGGAHASQEGGGTTGRAAAEGADAAEGRNHAPGQFGQRPAPQ
jgi:hypothetical protein